MALLSQCDTVCENAKTARLDSVIEPRIYVFIGDTPDGTLFLFSIRRMAYCTLDVIFSSKVQEKGRYSQ